MAPWPQVSMYGVYSLELIISHLRTIQEVIGRLPFFVSKDVIGIVKLLQSL